MTARTEKVCHIVRCEPNAGVPVELTAHVSGFVEKHWGQLEVSDFQSDLILTEAEREACEDELIDHARTLAGPLGFPEQEPEARRYSP